MANKLIIIILLFLFIFSCSKEDFVLKDISGKMEKVGQVQSGFVHPVLLMEIVEIPSNGKVFQIEGNAEIKKAKVNKYIAVEINTIVGPGDILWIKKDSIVEIKFDNNSHFKNEPKLKETFFTFELK